jgi:2-dehydropantoate 2-reductase
MKILVMGSGGVGGFYGGRRAHGLVIESKAQGDIRLAQVKVTDDPASVGPVDLVLIAVKLWDTETAARAVKSSVGPQTVVLSLQNGVIKDDILQEELGAAAVVGGAGYVATHISRPGVILQTGALQRAVIGEYDGRRTPRVEALRAALVKAGIEAEIAADIRRTLWEKFTFLVGLSGTTATMRMPIGPIRSNLQTRAFLLEIMKETVAVGRALGVALPENYAEDRLRFADSVPADMTSSLHHDLERGNRLEVEWLSGGVVQLGSRAGVPTPANRAVWDILALYAQGRRQH